MRSIIATAFSTLLSFTLNAAPPPTDIHYIHCGNYDSQLAADVRESQLKAQGINSIEQVQSGHTISVCVGKFTTNSEAWAYSRLLKDFGVVDATVLSLPNIAGENFESSFDMPVPRLLIPETTKYTPQILSREQLEFTTEALSLQSAVEAGDFDLIIGSGTALIESLPDSNPLKSLALVEVSRSLVQREKESAPALPYLLKVARGEVASTEEDLIEARFMVADSWHYYWFAPLKGFRAYKEILQEHGNKEDVAARCKVEMLACLLEMARMPNAEWKSSFADVRRMSEIIKETVPAEFDRVHAVARLIEAETYIYQHESDPQYFPIEEMYPVAEQLLLEFEISYPDRVRELSMVNHLRGYIAYKLGDWQTAKSLYERNLNLRITDSNECFYWKGEQWNMSERSARRLLEFSKEIQDVEATQFYTEYLDNKDYRLGVPENLSAFDTAFPHSFYRMRKK